MTLPEGAELTALSLRVRDLDRMVAYYHEVLGFRVTSQDGSRTSLALGDARFTVDLLHDPEAPLRGYPCVGLYHFALVVPDRTALGAIFRRLIERDETFEGMADHAVSEALYIRDPEHNGIELYRDRPKADWPHLSDGSVAMVSEPLDTDGILGSAPGSSVLHPDTRFGHIHLHVPALEAADDFYAGTLGLGVTQRSLRGALFFAAGDYHHHVGANIWAPNSPVPDGATGLVDYTWCVPSGRAVPDRPLRDPAGADVLFEAA